jgi:hypothetical protein
MIADVGLRGGNPSDTGRRTPVLALAAAQRTARMIALSSSAPLAAFRVVPSTFAGERS